MSHVWLQGLMDSSNFSLKLGVHVVILMLYCQMVIIRMYDQLSGPLAESCDTDFDIMADAISLVRVDGVYEKMLSLILSGIEGLILWFCSSNVLLYFSNLRSHVQADLYKILAY